MLTCMRAVTGMGRPTIKSPDSTSHCTITGVPTTYVGGNTYSIKVDCGTFAGGTGCAHIFRMTGGSVDGGTCADVNDRTAGTTTWTWAAPVGSLFRPLLLLLHRLLLLFPLSAHRNGITLRGSLDDGKSHAPWPLRNLAVQPAGRSSVPCCWTTCDMTVCSGSLAFAVSL
jgi:hypothetical protein